MTGWTRHSECNSQEADRRGAIMQLAETWEPKRSHVRIKRWFVVTPPQRPKI
jgi:hypothetical protein